MGLIDKDIRNLDLTQVTDEIKLLNSFYRFLRNHKSECAMDVIKEYCYENDLPIEELGYLISEDEYLKRYVENNLKQYKYIKSNRPQTNTLF